MSKKHKKKKKEGRWDFGYGYGYQPRKDKDKKKKKKDKEKGKNKPSIKSVRPSLSSKDGKKNRKIVMRPIEVDKEFTKRRLRCNHADGIMTLDEFKSMSMTAPAFTPMMERVKGLYGPEHVHICARCMDVLVDADQISADAAVDALTTLYATVNSVVARTRLKEDEIKEINRLKDVVSDFIPVVDLLQQIETDDTETPSASASVSDLNRGTNAVFMA